MAQEFPTDAELHKATSDLVQKYPGASYVETMLALIDMAKLSNKSVRSVHTQLQGDGELDELLKAYSLAFGSSYVEAIKTATAVAESKGISIRDGAEAALKDSTLYKQATALIEQQGVSMWDAMQALAAATKLRKK